MAIKKEDTVAQTSGSGFDLAAYRKENLRLVRCSIKCLDQNSSELHGRIYTIANKYLGNVSKYVPFDEAGESYHLPKVLFDHLKSLTWYQIREKTVNGKRIKESVEMPQFSIIELPPLTKEELRDLAERQKTTGAIGD